MLFFLFFSFSLSREQVLEYPIKGEKARKFVFFGCFKKKKNKWNKGNFTILSCLTLEELWLLGIYITDLKLSAKDLQLYKIKIQSRHFHLYFEKYLFD